MDLDISDILADVSRAATTHPHQQQAHYDSTTSYTDHQLLVRHWTSERCSPSLLPYPSALIDRTMTRLRDQITKIEDLTSGVDTSASNTYNGGRPAPASSGNNTNLILSILQTDLSRTQFIVRSYLRQRLAKMTKHAGYYLKHHSSTLDLKSSDPSSDGLPLLSPSEIQFLKHHQALLADFYDSSFLSSFPANLRRLDDSAGGSNMIEGPDAAQGVVVRCLATEWTNEDSVFDNREDDNGAGVKDENEHASVELRFRRGEVWVVRWRDVRDGVVAGLLECL